MNNDYIEKNGKVIIAFILFLVIIIVIIVYFNKNNDKLDMNIDDCSVRVLKLSDRNNSYVFSDSEQETICNEWKKLSKEDYGNDEKFDAEYVIYINDEQFSMVCEQIVVKYDGKYVLLNHNINEVLKRACYAWIEE